MAKFTCDFSPFEDAKGRIGGKGGSISGDDTYFSGISSDDMLEIIRPAAELLKAHYKATINRLFTRRTGSLADSIDAEDFGHDRAHMDDRHAAIFVGPTGKHKGGKRGARSRAGSSTRKYAKHNRTARASTLTNAELGYLLEFGTPRISATHWMENANEEIEETIQQSIEEEYDKYLKSKGLI